MALTLDQLKAARDALVTARSQGVLSYADQNGERVEYKSDKQMASALAALDVEISKVAGLAAPTKLNFVTTKGT